MFSAYDNTPMSSKVENNLRYILKNVNSNRQNIYFQTELNTDIVSCSL